MSFCIIFGHFTHGQVQGEPWTYDLTLTGISLWLKAVNTSGIFICEIRSIYAGVAERVAGPFHPAWSSFGSQVKGSNKRMCRSQLHRERRVMRHIQLDGPAMERATRLRSHKMDQAGSCTTGLCRFGREPQQSTGFLTRDSPKGWR